MVTTPARPNSRISARPMTKGGVMIGRMDSARSSGFIGMRVRSATSAKARPSSVVSTPTSVASATVFHATPQLRPPDEAVEAPDRRAEQLFRELRRGRSRRRCRGPRRRGCRAPGRTRTARSGRPPAGCADDEHVALAHAEPREAVGEQHEAGERVESGAPAHRRLHRTGPNSAVEPGDRPSRDG